MQVAANRRKRGQGMTEYIIVIAIVAIGAIAILGLFGRQIKGAFARIGSAISGKAPTAAAVVTDTETANQDGMGTFDADATK